MLQSLQDLLQGATTYVGGLLVVIGAISLGVHWRAITEGGGGGAQLAGAVAMVVGGLIVIAAAGLFGSLDTTWATPVLPVAGLPR